MSRLANSTRLHMDRHTLHAERATEDGYVTATIDLNQQFGNRRGKLVSRDGSESTDAWRHWSSRELRGTILHTWLRMVDLPKESRGSWTSDEIDLDQCVFWEGKELKFGQIAAEDEDDCNDLRLLSDSDQLNVHDGTLFAKSEKGDQRINLNLKLGNNDGTFDLNGVNFSMSAGDCAVNGTILTAKLKKMNRQWKSDQVDLRRFVRWRNDALEFCNQPMVAQRATPVACDCCRPLFRHGRFFLPLKHSPIHLKPPFEGKSCPMCSFLRLIVRDACRPEDDLLECVLFPAHLKSYRQAMVEVITQRSVDSTVQSAIQYVIYNRGDPQTSSKTFHAVPRSPLSDAWFEPDQRWPLVHEWMANCTKNHIGDCQTEKWPPLPARVLDLVAVDDGIVRLRVTEGECGRYACVSYRWGKQPSVTLTTANQDQFQWGGVEVSRLPKTLRDVVGVCGKLAIRYLWVDSLCIQQDSKSDWQVESLKMASYYGSCVLCIAATSSPHADRGWKSNDRPSAIKFSGLGPDSLPFRLLAYPLKELEAFDESRHFTQISEREIRQDFKLLTRGWAFQERRLAPRILHLCEYEVLFECATETVCECGQSKAYQINWTKAIPEPKLRLYGYNDAVPSSEGKDNPKLDKQWRLACAAYSTLDLTFPADKLPSISGIAKSMQFTGRYLAGLREEHLLADMCWYVGPELVVDDPRITAQNTIRERERLVARKDRAGVYIAPSWSWASVQEPVSFLPVATFPRTKAFVTLMDAAILPQFADWMGAINPGSHLKLNAKIIETAWDCNLSCKEPVDCYKLRDVEGMQGQFGMFPFAGQSANQFVKPGHPDDEGPEKLRFLPDYSITTSPRNSLSMEEKLYVMPLQSELAYLHTSVMKRPPKEDDIIIGLTGGAYGPSRYAKVSALVLRRLAKHELELQTFLPVFERIGFTWHFAKRPLAVESGSYVKTNLILI